MNLKPSRANFCLLLAGFVLMSGNVFAQAVSYQAYVQHKVLLPVPPGNRNVDMPALPAATIQRRTRMVNSRSFDKSYIDAMNLLAQPATLDLIRSIAQKYQVDVVHVLAALVGEHTFNVGMGDTAQGFYLKAMKWGAKWSLQFSANKVNLADLVRDPIMANCQAQTSDYYKWECIRATWESQLRGKNYNGAQMPGRSFRSTFFNPVGSGFTYGIGQLDPLKALMLSDVVSQTSGASALSVDDPAGIYTAIIDPNTSLQYTTVLVAKITEFYRTIANFDISENPGITATLYNIGFELQRAQASFNANKKALAARGNIIFPEENYYGWAINTRIDDLHLLAAGKWRGVTTSTVSLDEAADAAIARQNGTAAAADDTGLNLFNFLK